MATTTAANGQAVIRALKPGVELRDGSDGAMPTLHGHFAVFDRWAEIDSWQEGHFLERLAPGAFRKTFTERKGKIRALFQHGMDPQIGDKPLGPVDRLEEDKTGAYYEVPLLDTAYNRELIPGLQAGLYGASFRFNVVRQVIDEKPKRSDDNPDGLPERTITEAAVSEFGPVTFPAYAEATAGVRSLTDRFLFEAIEQNPERMRALVSMIRMDVEDLDTLAQMIQLGAAYIDDQDEPGDQANVPVMEAILAQLAGLVPVEVAENEPMEPEDAGRNKTTDAATRSTSGRKPDAATPRTSDVTETPTRKWPVVTDDEWEELWTRRT